MKVRLRFEGRIILQVEELSLSQMCFCALLHDNFNSQVHPFFDSLSQLTSVNLEPETSQGVEEWFCNPVNKTIM